MLCEQKYKDLSLIIEPATFSLSLKEGLPLQYTADTIDELLKQNTAGWQIHRQEYLFFLNGIQCVVGIHHEAVEIRILGPLSLFGSMVLVHHVVEITIANPSVTFRDIRTFDSNELSGIAPVILPILAVGCLLRLLNNSFGIVREFSGVTNIVSKTNSASL